MLGNMNWKGHQMKARKKHSKAVILGNMYIYVYIDSILDIAISDHNNTAKTKASTNSTKPQQIQTENYNISLECIK